MRRFKFKTLQKRYFQFKLPTFSQRQKPLTGADVIQNTKQRWSALTYLKPGTTGLMAMDATTELNHASMMRGVQKALPSMNMVKARTRARTRLLAPFVSWDVMNRMVHLAFRHLEMREMTAWKRMMDKQM